MPPAWIVVLSALLTPTIAIFGVYIAWQQWRLGRNKLKHDLFERRFRLYEGAVRPLVYIQSSGKMTTEAFQKFMIETRDVKWLLRKEVEGFLHGELKEKFVDLGTLCSEFDGPLSDQERTSNLRKQREIKEWISQQQPKLDALFAPYLTLGAE